MALFKNFSKINFTQTKFILGAFYNRNFSTEMKETTIDLQGQTINYLKVGTGKKTILLLPGALGTIWTDFRPQIEKLDKNKLTIVAWDPPGYGKSRPPKRTFDKNLYHTDAKLAAELMNKLNIPKYSLVGWSDGGITSLILAAKNPERIEALVEWGANSYIIKEELEGLKKIRDVSKWSERMRKPMIEVYGEAYFRELWENWVDTIEVIYKENNGNICKEILSDIKCPTFIIHGAQDAVCHSDHPTYLHKEIKGSKLHVFPDGKHNLHLKYADEFNDMVTKFIESV
ncbi:valacyclovir hydrolase-like [Chrysoperla carnea]|uniref:valacyclovir hydrolase-like n=1 Tax=Chrysoperla carnea TaxID=189513 RepID=UPI001D099A5B|nr:valacyclovir hydrolase-like [Chrysoperla carnea]